MPDLWAMGPRSPSRWRLARRTVRRCVIVSLLLICVTALEIGRRGLPPAITHRIEALLSSDLLCTEIGRTTVTLGRGIEIRDVAVYAKRVTGPALLRARRARIALRPRRSATPAAWIESVTIHDARIHPFPYAPDRALTPRSAVRIPDVPEVTLIPFHILRADVLGTGARDIRANISVEGRILSVTEISLNVAAPHEPAEQITGECHLTLDVGTIEGRLNGAVDLGRLVPLLTSLRARFVAQLVDRFDFSTFPAAAGVQFTYTPHGPRQIHFQAKAQAFRYREVPLLEGHATVTVGGSNAWERVDVGALEVTRQEGSARGQLRYLFGAHRLEVSGHSTLDPHAVARIINVLNEGQLADVSFDGGGCELSAAGALTFGAARRIDVRGRIRSPALSIRGIPLRNAAADFTVGVGTARLDHVTATLCGGTAEGEVSFSRKDPALNSWHYAARAAVKEARFGDLCQLISHTPNTFGGTLSGDLTLRAPIGAEHSNRVKGAGHVSVREGDLFRLPIFAGMTDVMARYVPGVESLVSQSDASMAFVIGQGGLHTDDLSVEGGVFSLVGKGDYYFTDELDFAIQVRLLKQKTLGGRVLKVLTFPISKLFEFRVTGSRKDTEWYPENFSLRPSPSPGERRPRVIDGTASEDPADT